MYFTLFGDVKIDEFFKLLKLAKSYLKWII